MSHLLRFFSCFLISSIIIGNCASINILGQSNKEYLNKIDEAGMKQGYWEIKKDDRVVEEGNYVNNKKHGIWKAYYENRKLKHEITFVNGEAQGPAHFYYENGKLRESGNWQKDHWEGSYQYYYESGTISYDWFYNDNGKRQGEQRYFHANGQVMYQGQWENGNTEGALKVYDENGQLIQEKFYNNGTLSQIERPTTHKPRHSTAKFTETGFHTIINMDGQIDKKGFFVKGKLYNGEKHHYDKEGHLTSITHYKNGEVVEAKDLERMRDQ
ncbi:toxin-antitoxin system YwqK family antitoxin [Saccharicrinis fermentans]|uniref:MORN repeat variant n=1 Tax=Saccharicrinis fermentans DSM 9555 = JCM 21142 TaxID=869213 RepID=W7Y464_9BACT|nr:toxin-antitoxin system YwqK family antitoxin [Saccharicrinis fermentans]GAF02862.1 MORN repeat variant [Saccharicrinis fermentans DSM 9555 = JCM 21142]